MSIPDFLCTPYTCPPLTPGWPTGYMPYREIAYRDFAMSDVQCSCQYRNPIPEIPYRALINGPGAILTQRLRLNRNIAFRDFGVSVAVCS
jgi:hypothetical protein